MRCVGAIEWQSMTQPIGELLTGKLRGVDPSHSDYAPRAVDALLAVARDVGATDIHLQPSGTHLELKFRVDGVLLPAATFPAALAGNVVSRLKVLAGLLTYHSDRPQEGRIRLPQDDVEMRVCTYPTLHGERAVVRLFGGAKRYQHLDDLGLPDDVLPTLQTLVGQTSGAILVSGPAGSGKTTTIYACLREIARRSGGQRSLMSIEDPVEVSVGGVAQSQVHPTVGLDLAAGLRFLMRQDPEVIMVGEIRDRPTADAALQASLTGHLLLSTFHAGSAAETVGRLLDMASSLTCSVAAFWRSCISVCSAGCASVPSQATNLRHGSGCRSSGQRSLAAAPNAAARVIAGGSFWSKCSCSRAPIWPARSYPGPIRPRSSAWPSRGAWLRGGSAPAAPSMRAGLAPPRSAACWGSREVAKNSLGVGGVFSEKRSICT